MTYYEVLQVARDASPEVIEASWKALLRKFHPDRPANRTAQAKEKAYQINEAHDILSDPKKRKEYDRSLVLESTHVPHAESTRRTARPGRAYGAAYGPAYAGQAHAPATREPESLIKDFIQDIARNGELDINTFVETAQEVMLSRLAEHSPILAALMREQLERGRK
jgi:curved DNA-binding protein CbpA